MIGQTISHYKIVEKLGEGGMGVVYKAEDLKLGRAVALKFLPSHLLESEEHKARFLHEARAAALLDQPNICAVYEIDEVEGKTFLALAWLEGQTLNEKIAARPLPLQEALGIALQIGQGLQAAHERGVVHRDIKPANIMITPQGQVKIMDFGLAQLSDRTKLTASGMKLGTPAYMSPEQTEGKQADRRSDIWALGVVLYEMISGGRPFLGEQEAAVAHAILYSEPEPPTGLRSGLPIEVDRVIGKALAKDPGDRYQHIDDMAVDLKNLQEIVKSGRSRVAPPAAASGVQQRPESKPSSRLPAAALAGILGLAIGAATAYLLQPGAAGKRPAWQATQVTFDSRLSFEPALSRDGNLLVYSSDAAGRGDLDIWVQQVSGGNPIRLTDDPADDRQPDISPDGSRIVFRSERGGGGLYTMPALGGDAVLLVRDESAQGAYHPRFSPDGETVAYWVGAETADVTVARYATFVVQAKGGTPRKIAENLDTSLFPAWSPDGESLLVWSELGGERDWWLAPAAGGPARKTRAADVLPRLPTLAFPWRWEPGSNAVYFSDRYPGSSPTGVPNLSNLWRLVLSPQTGEVIGTPEQLTSGPGSQITPAPSSGERIALAEVDLNPNIWSAALDGDRLTLSGDVEPLIAGDSWESRPSASWDGTRVAFRSNRGGGMDFWLKDLPSGQLSQLSRDGQVKVEVFLAPDGSRAAYVNLRGGRTTFLTTGEGTPRKLCERCQVYGWFPDGRRLLVKWQQEPDAPIRLGVLDADSASLVAFEGIDALQGVDALEGWVQGLWRIGPDGRWIATSFGAERGRPSLSLISLDGVRLGPEVIEAAPEAASFLQWHPAGNGIFFLSNKDGFQCLWAVRLDPKSKQPLGKPFAVHHFHDRAAPLIGNYWVSRDRIFFGIHETTGNVWLLEPSERQP